MIERLSFVDDLDGRKLELIEHLPSFIMPEWLQQAHRRLDEAVAAAYGWPATISEEDALAALLALNHARPAAGSNTSKEREER